MMIEEENVPEVPQRDPYGPGFYKLMEDGDIGYAPNAVHHRDFKLLKESKDDYTYPVDGWYWFESEEEANTNLGVASG